MRYSLAQDVAVVIAPSAAGDAIAQDGADTAVVWQVEVLRSVVLSSNAIKLNNLRSFLPAEAMVFRDLVHVHCWQVKAAPKSSADTSVKREMKSNFTSIHAICLTNGSFC